MIVVVTNQLLLGMIGRENNNNLQAKRWDESRRRSWRTEHMENRVYLPADGGRLTEGERGPRAECPLLVLQPTTRQGVRHLPTPPIRPLSSLLTRSLHSTSTFLPPK